MCVYDFVSIHECICLLYFVVCIRVCADAVLGCVLCTHVYESAYACLLVCMSQQSQPYANPFPRKLMTNEPNEAITHTQ